jgi:hypothetical protein
MSRHVTVVALACFLVCFASVNYDVVLDGAESTYYGFPLPWNARLPATSLVKDVFVIPALVDLAFVSLLASFVFRFADRMGARISTILGRTSIFLGIIGLVEIGLTFYFNDSFFSYLPESWPKQITVIRVGWGL